MKQKDKSIEARLGPLISESKRVSSAIETLCGALKSTGLSNPKLFQSLDKWAVDDLDRLLAAVVSALRLQTFSIHDPRIRELGRPLNKREKEALFAMQGELGPAGWMDHVSAADIGDETYFVAEPYELTAAAFSDFERLRQSGWIVRVFLPLATYFPTQAIPVVFRKLRDGETLRALL